MAQTPQPVSYGPGFTSILTLLFITLKLLGKISWSWWLVLSPMLACGALAIGALIVCLVVFILAVIQDK